MRGRVLAAGLWLLMSAPAAAAGQLEVRTDPPGAHVYLDQRHAGMSPLVIEAPPGAHRLTAHMRGYEPAAVEVAIVDGLTRRAALSLRPLGAGELRVVTQPAGAEVHLDGRSRGRTPLVARGLQPGAHALVVALPGHRRVSQSVRVHDGLTTTLALSLIPLAQPAPAAPRRQAPPPPAEAPVATPRPTSPPTPRAEARFAAAPPAPAASEAEPPAADARVWIFPGLLAAMAIGLALRAGPAGRRPAPGLAWQPPAPARGPQPWPATGRPDVASRQARSAMQRQRWEDVRLALRRAIEAGGDTPWHFHHLGLACQLAGHAAEAEAAYRTALQLEPAHPDAGYNLGVLHASAAQLPQAVMAYRRHLDAHPRDAMAHFNLGCAYFALDMHPQAAACWHEARKLQPRHAGVKRNQALLARLGRARRRQAG